jgi:hypothetical protein
MPTTIVQFLSAHKGNFFGPAAKEGIAILCPDTSPRGAGIEGEDDDWDFGTGMFPRTRIYGDGPPSSIGFFKQGLVSTWMLPIQSTLAITTCARTSNSRSRKFWKSLVYRS